MSQLDLGSVRIDVDERFRLNTLVLVSDGTEASDPTVSGNYRASFVLTTSGRPVPAAELEAYVEAEVKKIQQLPGFSQLAREAASSQTGAPAILQRHAFKDGRGTQLEQLQAFVVGKDAVLIGTATHVSGAPFTAMETTFRKMLLSLQPR